MAAFRTFGSQLEDEKGGSPVPVLSNPASVILSCLPNGHVRRLDPASLELALGLGLGDAGGRWDDLGTIEIAGKWVGRKLIRVQLERYYYV